VSAWLGLLLSLFLILSPPRVVTITDFHAEGHSDRVQVFWETATETDNAGFNLYRDTSPGGSFGLKLNGTLIPSQVPPGSPVGASYQFTDSNVEPGVTYYYKLEAIDLGAHSQWHDHIASATVPADTTVTPTSTSTPTTTVSPSPTDTPVPTVSGSPTPYVPATAPGGGTATPTSTTTGTPAASSTPTATGTPAITPSPTQPGPGVTPSPSAISPSATRPPGATAPPTKPPAPGATWTPPAVVTPPPAGPTSTAGPMPSATRTPAPTAPPIPSPTPTPTSFPTVPPQQPSPLPGICVQALSYGWLVAGAAVLLVLVAAFAVLMARGRREEP